jgi:hypothetical protein
MATCLNLAAEAIKEQLRISKNERVRFRMQGPARKVFGCQGKLFCCLPKEQQISLQQSAWAWRSVYPGILSLSGRAGEVQNIFPGI